MNQDQIAKWNERSGRAWADLQPALDASLAGILAAALAAAGPRPGETVLDVGCGTGASTLALADAVGTSGRVTGLDVSKPMLELARARGAGRPNIAFVEADAAAHPFTDAYDLLFSRFGVMFFDDPIGAFANLHHALKPGGRLAFVCWRAMAENPWAADTLAAARPFLPQTPAPDPNAPGPFAFADSQRVLSVLSDVGFHDVETKAHDGVMDLGPDLDAAAGFMMRVGPMASAVAELDGGARANIAAALRPVLEKFRDARGVIAPAAACWLVTARIDG